MSGTSDQHRPSRRPAWLRWWVGLLVAVLIIGGGGGGFVWVEHARSVDVGDTQPGDGAVLGRSSVILACGLPGFTPGRGQVQLTLDGRSLAADELRLLPERVEADVSVADGLHSVVLDYTSSNLFSRHLSRSWSFTVDTTAPVLTLISPASAPLWEEDTLHVEVQVDEPAEVALRVDGHTVTAEAVDPGAGPFSEAVSLTEGEHSFVVTATDPLGNHAALEWQTWVDLEAPAIAVEDWPDGTEPWRTDAASVAFSVSDALPENLSVTASLDGQALQLTPGSEASAADGRTYSLETGALAEGEHELVLTAEDRAGHVASWQAGFLVDTVSQFGKATMRLGAIGNDVDQLQSLLAQRGLYSGGTTSVYDQDTVAAVAAYNGAHGLSHGDVVGQETLALLLGSIRIDISERKLYHYRDGQWAKTYAVAVGMPAHPTPTGSFEIISKVRNPTWTPPDSDWAAGMESVPPGAGNPLGTRWMGISSPSVGIHGTYSSSSIGTAASHGCIRMYLHEAEELFELVYVGTPVEIVR